MKKSTQAERALRVAEAIRRSRADLAEGDPLPLGNKRDPLDELFYIILTTMTQYGVDRAWENLKLAFPSWNQLLDPDAEARLRLVIQYCGLVNQKAPQILEIAKRLHADLGEVTLDSLRDMSDEDAEAYLLSLPRVGRKVARCVMMYSLGRDVLPVDAHVLRVGKRIGLLPATVSWAKAHDRIHEVVPPELRYSVHVGLVEHGRSICKHKNPRCSDCVLRNVCEFHRNRPVSTGQE